MFGTPLRLRRAAPLESCPLGVPPHLLLHRSPQPPRLHVPAWGSCWAVASPASSLEGLSKHSSSKGVLAQKSKSGPAGKATQELAALQGDSGVRAAPGVAPPGWGDLAQSRC